MAQFQAMTGAEGVQMVQPTVTASGTMPSTQIQSQATPTQQQQQQQQATATTMAHQTFQAAGQAAAATTAATQANGAATTAATQAVMAQGAQMVSRIFGNFV